MDNSRVCRTERDWARGLAGIRALSRLARARARRWGDNRRAWDALRRLAQAREERRGR